MGPAKAPAAAPVIEYFGFLENGLQTQDSFRLTLKAFADLIVRTAIAKADYNTAIPTPSGMALGLFLKTPYNSFARILGVFRSRDRRPAGPSARLGLVGV